MKINQNRPHIRILYLPFLMALISACSTQSQDNQNIQGNDKTPLVESKIDSTLRLKYTTGIRSILEDSEGNCWFGSYQEGVCRFDGKKMTYYTTEDGLSDNQIRSIFEDANGIVWFEGGRGISSYDGKKISTQTEKDYSSKNEWAIGPNDLWFKGDETVGYNQQEGQAGVYRYDGHQLSYHVFPLAGINEYSVSTPFVRGKNGRLWFGTYGAVLGYDGTFFTVIDKDSLWLDKETGNLHVRSIFEDSKGTLWIGNNGIGVLLHDGTTTINFSEQQGLMSENSLRRGGYRSPAGSLEHVFSIGEDREGNMWFGDRDTGAWRYDGTSMRNYTKKDGLTTTHIWQIHKTKNGELWFAMANGDVLKFNGEAFERIF